MQGAKSDDRMQSHVASRSSGSTHTMDGIAIGYCWNVLRTDGKSIRVFCAAGDLSGLEERDKVGCVGIVYAWPAWPVLALEDTSLERWR